MARIWASLLTVTGAVVVGFSPNRWDDVVLELPRSHGIHLHDIIGMALIALGIAIFWRLPAAPRGSQ